MDWIHLAQDRVKWGAPVNMVMNFQVSSLAKELSASQGRLCSTE